MTLETLESELANDSMNYETTLARRLVKFRHEWAKSRAADFFGAFRVKGPQRLTDRERVEMEIVRRAAAFATIERDYYETHPTAVVGSPGHGPIADCPVIGGGDAPAGIIYGLVSQAEPERVRYVGQTVCHRCRYLDHSTRWPWAKMILLEAVPAVDLLSPREVFWFNFFRVKGGCDLNRVAPPAARL